MARNNMTNQGNRSYLDNRRQVINASQPQINGKNLDEFQRQQEQFNKEKSRIEAPPKFKKSRGFFLLKGNYLVVTLSTILLIINTVLRGFNGTWWYLVPNIAFLVVVILFGSYFNPLDYASDTDKYIRPKLDKVYLDLQRILTQLLVLSGTNLHKDNKSSYKHTIILFVLGTIPAILFYNSGFAILGVPFLMMFVVRSIASGKIKESASQLGFLKWVMFLLLLINTILSAYWKTPFGFETFVLISFLNSTELWMKNTELYGLEKIQQLSAEEQRRKNEAHSRQLEEQQKAMMLQQNQQQMQSYPQQMQQVPGMQQGQYPQGMNQQGQYPQGMNQQAPYPQQMPQQMQGGYPQQAPMQGQYR